MKQWRVKGIDDEGKTHWMQESRYWGEARTAGLFTRVEAEVIVAECNTRNRYLHSDDRIVASVEGAY